MIDMLGDPKSKKARGGRREKVVKNDSKDK